MRTILSLILVMFLGIANTFAHQEGKYMMGHQEMNMKEDIGICPVMHNPASKEYSYTYEGKTYYFCCPMCIDSFKKNPQEYISKIKEIKVEAFQYGYSPDPIVVKKGDIVKLFATSRDVPHGISIKEYGINTPVKKGETKRIEFLADKAGEFDILCSVYCGPGHQDMKAKLVVEE